MLQSQSRGVVSSNPKSGRLAAQLDASKSAPKGLAPEPRQQEQLVVSACLRLIYRIAKVAET